MRILFSEFVYEKKKKTEEGREKESYSWEII